MRPIERWRSDPVVWIEIFALANFAFLILDIFMAHSVNSFRHGAEYIPLYFSGCAAALLFAAIFSPARIWRALGLFVGWTSVAVGLSGVVYHLQSSFFLERTLKSLTYAAPFAAPLAYMGLGLLVIMNRMVDVRSNEWARWVLLLALGGFVGNLGLSLTDHAVNGFFRAAEWIPVVSAAYAVGFLLTPLLTRVTRRYLRLCGWMLAAQVIVGLIGFGIHATANIYGPSAKLLQNFIDGAPPFAPLLFANLSLLAGIALWVISQEELNE